MTVIKQRASEASAEVYNNDFKAVYPGHQPHMDLHNIKKTYPVFESTIGGTLRQPKQQKSIYKHPDENVDEKKLEEYRNRWTKSTPITAENFAKSEHKREFRNYFEM